MISIYFITGGVEDIHLSYKLVTFFIFVSTAAGLLKNKVWALNMAIVIVIWCIVGDIRSILEDTSNFFSLALVYIISFAVYLFELKILMGKSTRQFFYEHQK